jgi:hypothetical protein
MEIPSIDNSFSLAIIKLFLFAVFREWDKKPHHMNRNQSRECISQSLCVLIKVRAHALGEGPRE